MLPKFLKPVLWSYDFERCDAQKHKKLIIKQILGYGTKKMMDWMFTRYSSADIEAVFKQLQPTALDKKSYNFWKILFN